MINYKWVKHIFKESVTLDNGRTQIRQVVTICLLNTDSGLYLVSPFTDFISKNYSLKKTTTQVAAVNVVISFLNYVYLSRDKSIENVQYQDGIDFLNSKDVCKKTKKSYANYLSNFYRYLYKNEILRVSNDVDINHLFVDDYKNRIDKNKPDVLHQIKVGYLPIFLQIAQDVTPEIALGVYLQCFGGLRCSEIVSLEYSNIAFSEKENGIRTMYLNLKDKDLRPDLESAFIAKTKVNRKQGIIPAFGNMLFEFYNLHKKRYKINGISAIFIDENGNPMTAKTYGRKFQNFKKEFIKRLSSSDLVSAKGYAVSLSNYRWGTHICRGIFSNLVAAHSRNISEIAIWRGDKSLSSSLAYLNDSQSVANHVIAALDLLYSGGYVYEK